MKIKEELFAYLRDGFYVSAAEMVEIMGATDLNHEHVKRWLTQCGLSGYEIKNGLSTGGWTFIAPSRTASRSARQASKSRRHFRSAASRFRKLLADP